MNEWREQFYTPEWYQRKREIIAGNDCVCVYCGNRFSEEDMTAHHVYYEQDRKVWESTCLEPCCYQCNKEVKSRMQIARRLYELGLNGKQIVDLFDNIVAIAEMIARKK